MELGELVTVVVDMPAQHSVKTCPWHEETPGNAEKLAPANIEEDVPPPGLPDNDGGVLGRKLGNKPARFQVHLKYRQVKKKIKNTENEITEYEEDSAENPYYASYSAHHVIPGNEALAEHPVLRWVGDQSALGDYGEGVSCELKDGEFIGYDINESTNGVWLPGPYPLSTKGKWTDKDLASPTALSFKRAYAFAVMDAAKRQFHYRHSKYSEVIQLCLSKVDTRLQSFAPKCQKDESGEPAKPYKAPLGLVARFNRISDRMRPLLAGQRWHPDVYTDNDAGPPYIATAKARNLIAPVKRDWKDGFK